MLVPNQGTKEVLIMNIDESKNIELRKIEEA